MTAPQTAPLRRLPAPEVPAWLERGLPFERYLVDVGGGVRMHVMERGDGIPVVMLHGNPTWGILWRKVAGALEPSEVRVILPDLVGLGLSDKPADERLHNLEQHAAWFGRLLDELNPGPFVFVGQDWGGPIGLRALADRPDLCAGVVLGNTVIGPPRPGFKPSLFHRLARMPVVSDALFRWAGFPQNALFVAQGDKRSIQPLSWEARAYRWPLRGRARNLAPLALARMVPDSPDHPSIPALRRCDEFITSFDGPIALVWGVRDPVLGRVINHVERMLPRAQVRRTPAGHFLQEEVPAEIAQAIRDVAGRAFAKRART